jgi:hypothetical protein
MSKHGRRRGANLAGDRPLDRRERRLKIGLQPGHGDVYAEYVHAFTTSLVCI